MKNTMITLISTFIFLLTLNITSNCQVEEAPPPPPPPPSAKIYKVVEDMPRFPGCENMDIEKKEKQKCAEGKMLNFIYSRISYPKIARQNGIEGRVILQFVINKDGTVSDTRVLRDPGGGCGDEAARVVNLMPKWMPGRQRGKPVKVQYTLPVSFKLNNKKSEVKEEPTMPEVKEEPMIIEKPISKPEEPVIFKVVEEMPRFPGCEGQGLSKSKLKKCSEKKMLEYIYSNIEYPDVAKKDGIEGRVILQFIVDKDGSIINTKVLRDPGGGCGEEAARVANSMPKWIPAKQRGQPVKVQYTLPVSFRLDKKKFKKRKF